MIAIPEPWRPLLQDETAAPYFVELTRFLDEERAAHAILPAAEDVLAALALTAPEAVRVVILGQDPYPTPGHAHGLAFSVRRDVRPLPGSLRNVLRELQADLGIAPSAHGHLSSWARQGVLLLNTVLTVRAGQAASHADRGWERFTDRVLAGVAAGPEPVVFLLWGAHAQKKKKTLALGRHVVIACAHPSPLSARTGFFGSRCFSRANAALEAAGRPPIDWRLPA